MTDEFEALEEIADQNSRVPIRELEELPEGAAFFCEDCDAVVFTVGLDPTPEVHACFACRYIRAHPDLTDDIKRALRGDDR